MKKFLYILLLAVTVSTTIVSCTDENVAPKTNEGGSGGVGIDPKGPQ